MNVNNLISLENGFLVDKSNGDVFYLNDNGFLINTKNKTVYYIQENYLINSLTGEVQFLTTPLSISWSSYWINLIFTQDEQFYLLTEDDQYYIMHEPPPPPGSLLKLTFDDIVNVPVADASSVSDWNTWFDLPTNGTPYTSVSVDGNVVTLEGGSEIKFKDYLFGDDACGEHILEIEDSGCVTELGEGVFSDWGNGNGCYSLTKAIFPYATMIGEWCFADCEALIDVDLALVIEYPSFSFYNCGFTSFEISSTTISLGEGSVSSLLKLERFVVDVNNPNFKEVDGVLFSKDGTIIISYPTGITDSSYTVPNGVTTIGSYCFSNCLFEELIIPSSILYLEGAAIQFCNSLMELIIPEGCLEIKEWDNLYLCQALTYVSVPSTVTVISSLCQGCEALERVDMYPMNAPMAHESAFFNADFAIMHIQSGATGYTESPWTEMNYGTIVFNIVQDL